MAYSGQVADDSGIGGSGSGYGMDGSGYGGGECCPTKKIWGSKNPEKDGFYDLVVDENMMENGMGYGMGSGSGEGMGCGYGNMEDMEWSERCRRFCVYKKSQIKCMY